MNHTATYSPEDDKIRLYLAYRLSAEEYAPVKAAGYHSAPKQGHVFAYWSIKAEDLALELCGEIDDEDKSLVERAEERAERFEDYSDNRKKDADQAHAAVKAITDNIPFGQPILVGHHSEKHARRDAKRIDDGMRRAVKMWDTSQYWQQRAKGALANAKYKDLPGVRARRIKTIEADLNKCIARYTPVTTKDRPKPMVNMQQRWSALYPADGSPGDKNAPEIPHVYCGPKGWGGGFWVPVEDLEKIKAGYARYEAHLRNRLEYERAMLEEQDATHLLDRKPKSAAAQLPLCNYRAPEGLDIPNEYHRNEMLHYAQVEMTQAEYSKIYTDYKGTRAVNNSHRVRICIRHHAWLCVFITDSKVHTPPAPADPPKPKEPTAEEIENRLERLRTSNETREAQKVDAAPFDALRETLKTGIQVVSVPQLFPTPHETALYMADLADIRPDSDILEPSAGTGALLSGITDEYAHVTAIEINPTLADRLRETQQAGKVTVRCVDFLECTNEIEYDRILMNPPFENGADIKHITHAIKSLAAGGRLVALCANGPRQQEKLKPLADHWEELPAGTFEGTQVRAALMVYSKPTEPQRHATKDGKCANCGRLAVLHSTGECSWCTPKETLEAEPTLSPTEVTTLLNIAAGRQDISLREGKVYDRERLIDSPLFKQQGRLF